MADIFIEDVPESWIEALLQRAAHNHRSLEGELLALIEQAVQGDLHGGDSADAPAKPSVSVSGWGGRGNPIIRHGWITVEQVVAELNARYPGPVTGVPLGVDIIRTDRDAR